jgi:hypothetical protein
VTSESILRDPMGSRARHRRAGDLAGGLAARPKATWRWWEALGVYLLVFFVAGFAVSRSSS